MTADTRNKTNPYFLMIRMRPPFAPPSDQSLPPRRPHVNSSRTFKVPARLSRIAAMGQIIKSIDLQPFESGSLPPYGPRRHASDLSRARLLRQFLSNPVDALPPVDFPKNVGWRNAALGPDDRKMIEDV